MSPHPNGILFVIPSLGNGGAERVVLLVANGLAERGFKVGLGLYSDKGHDYLPELRPEIPVYWLGTRHGLHGRIINTLRLVRAALAFDIVVSALETFTEQTVIAAARILAISRARRRYFAMVHTVLSRYGRFRLPASRRRSLCKAYRRFDGIIAVSQGIKQDLVEIFGLGLQEKIAVINNPLDLKALEEKAGEPMADLPAEPFFVAIGRLVIEKDHATLLLAFKRFLEAGGRVRALLIIGRGPEAERIKRMISELHLEDRVRLLGFRVNPWPYLKAASALVSTSTLEGFQLTLAESLACGTPVIATDCPVGPREILQDGRNGLLVPVADIEAIASAMHEVERSSAAARDRAERGRAFIRRYRTDVIIRRYIELFADASMDASADKDGCISDD